MYIFISLYVIDMSYHIIAHDLSKLFLLDFIHFS